MNEIEHDPTRYSQAHYGPGFGRLVFDKELGAWVKWKIVDEKPVYEDKPFPWLLGVKNYGPNWITEHQKFLDMLWAYVGGTPDEPGHP